MKTIKTWGLIDKRVQANMSFQKGLDDSLLKNNLDRINVSDIVEKLECRVCVKKNQDHAFPCFSRLHAFPFKNIGTFLDNIIPFVFVWDYVLDLKDTVNVLVVQLLTQKDCMICVVREALVASSDACVNQCIKRALGTVEIPSIHESCG